MQTRRSARTPAIMLSAVVGAAVAGPDGADKRSEYEVETESGQEVLIQRRADGSFDLDFGAEPQAPGGPSGRVAEDEELLVSLPQPVLEQLMAQWQPQLPFTRTSNGWWMLRFDGEDGSKWRAMVLDDIASRMGWPWLARKAVDTLYLRPDMVAH